MSQLTCCTRSKSSCLLGQSHTCMPTVHPNLRLRTCFLDGTPKRVQQLSTHSFLPVECDFDFKKGWRSLTFTDWIELLCVGQALRSTATRRWRFSKPFRICLAPK